MGSSGRPYERWGASAPAADARRTLQIAFVAMAIGATSSAWAVLALVGQPTGDGNAQTSVGAKTYQLPTVPVAEGQTAGGHTVKSTASAAPSVTPASTAIDAPSSRAPEVQVIATAPSERDTKPDVPSSPAAAESQVDLSRDKQPEKERPLIEANPKVDVAKDKEKEPPSVVDRKVKPYQRWAIRPRYPLHWPF